jgi:hypothetical protein
VYKVGVIRVPILRKLPSQEDRDTDDADFVRGFTRIFFWIAFWANISCFPRCPPNPITFSTKKSVKIRVQSRRHPCSYPARAAPRRRIGTRMTPTLYTDFRRFFLDCILGKYFLFSALPPKSYYLLDKKIRENPCTKSASSVFLSCTSGPRRRIGTRMTPTLYTDFRGFDFGSGILQNARFFHHHFSLASE